MTGGSVEVHNELVDGGRFRRIEETTLMLEGTDGDRNPGSARRHPAPTLDRLAGTGDGDGGTVLAPAGCGALLRCGASATPGPGQPGRVSRRRFLSGLPTGVSGISGTRCRASGA